MSTTTTINPAEKGGRSNKKNVAAHVGTAAAAAGIGAVGATIVSDKVHEDIAGNLETGAVDAATGTVQDGGNQSENEPVASAESPHPSPSAANGETVEPQPVTSGTDAAIGGVSEVAGPAAGDVAQEGGIPPSGPSQDITDTVNPDDIAEAIIAGEQVDPNDIDMANVVNFDEIGTVYTVDGESYTAATFHDAAGNQLVMVDVDGDDVFDVIADTDGNPIAEAPGNLTVDDAEINIADDGTYLAHNDNTDGTGTESIAQDLIS